MGAVRARCATRPTTLIFELIDERRASDGERARRRALDAARRAPRGRLADVAAGAARRADDAARRRPRDDRLGARLGVRAPRARARACSRALVDEIDGGDGDAYLTATIHETLRRRPVLPNAAPRLVKQPIEVGGWTLPSRASAWSPNAYLVHHDPDDLSRPVRLPPGALPRRAARHLHLDPVRRRPPPLPRRELRDARDEDRAARGAGAERAGARRRPARRARAAAASRSARGPAAAPVLRAPPRVASPGRRLTARAVSASAVLRVLVVEPAAGLPFAPLVAVRRYPAGVLQHPGEVEQVPRHERGIPVGEVVVRPA